MNPLLLPEHNGKKPFAENDLRFRGENDSTRYGPFLEQALNAWMHGESLTKPVRTWFPFIMPKPAIPSTTVKQAIKEYEDKRDTAFKTIPTGLSFPATAENLKKNGFAWIGGKPVCTGNSFYWMYMGELIEKPLPASISPRDRIALLDALWSLRPESSEEQPSDYSPEKPILEKTVFLAVRGCGLTRIRFS